MHAAAQEILETILSHLGFSATVEHSELPNGEHCLQIFCPESTLLIGEHGERLEDLQYLVNRSLRQKFNDAPRYKIDCEHYRAMQEEQLLEEIRRRASTVIETGTPYKIRPLNAYYRRLVHQALLEIPQIQCQSPEGEQRLKSMTLSRA